MNNQFEIQKITSGIAKGRFALFVDGWQIFETFKTLEEVQKEIQRRKKEPLERARPMNDSEIERLQSEIQRLKALLNACIAIFEHGVPVTTGFIDDLRKAAEPVKKGTN